MLFEYIIASFPFSAVKRAYFKLARMLLRSAETARGAPEIARQIRDGRLQSFGRRRAAWPGTARRRNRSSSPAIVPRHDGSGICVP